MLIYFKPAIGSTWRAIKNIHMKKIILSVACIILVVTVRAQLKTTIKCPTFTVDILDGKVNDVRSTATVGQIKQKLPCFTSA